MYLLLVSVVFAFVLGFSAHRASICTVAAVAEVITSGTAWIFLGFLKVVLWVVLINGLLVLWIPELARSFETQSPSLMVAAGGFVFGVGAAINGGCSFSTISKIAQGNLHVALTLPAFMLGLIFSANLLSGIEVSEPVSVSWIDERWYRLLVSALCLWGLWELLRILTINIRSGEYWRRIVADFYRLSTGAALIGICGGCLYVIHGRWAYSSKLVDSFMERSKSQGADGDIAIWLFIALLFGAIVSAISSRQFSFSFAADMWMRNVVGGILMGIGAMMVPGGNGALILQDLPALSVHALVAYFSMVLGIAVTLKVYARLTGKQMTVSCSGDFCSVHKDQQIELDKTDR